MTTYQSDLLNRVGVVHGFSTRMGGITPAPRDSLDLGYVDHVDPTTDGHAAENFRRFQAALGCGSLSLADLNQVHGAEVVIVKRVAAVSAVHDPSPATRLTEPWHTPNKQGAPRADALVSDDPSRLLAVRSADCVPLLLSSEDGRAVAAVHAGWRGLAAGVIRSAVWAMHESLGVSPRELVAAVGPCIGLEHFEVGPEVVEAFERIGLEHTVHHRHGWTRPHIDLSLAAAGQLLSLGIPADSIDRSDRCTYRDAADFFSYRRDHGQTGRLAAAIAVRAC